MKTITNLHSFDGLLPPDARAELDACFSRVRQLCDGELVYTPGDAPDYMYQIISGEIALCHLGVDDQEVTLTRFQPTDFFGHTGMIDDDPRINSTMAVGNTRVRMLSRADFRALCERHPEILRAFSIMQSRQIRLLLNMVVDATLLRLSARLARTLQRLSVSLGEIDADGNFTIPISQEDIAHFIGTTRPSINAELKKLEQAGIILSSYGKIIVTDRPRLASLGDEQGGFDLIVAGYPGRPADL